VKKKINEKMGGGARIGLGGVNAVNTSDNRYSTKHPTGYHTGGYQGNADSQISQRHSLIATMNEYDEEEEYDHDLFGSDDEDYEYYNDAGESDESLYELFIRIAKLSSIKEEKISDLEEEKVEDEEEVEEASGAGAVGGVTGKFGLFNSDGKRTTKKQYKNRLNHTKRTFGGN
jgi:hypothetical protein